VGTRNSSLRDTTTRHFQGRNRYPQTPILVSHNFPELRQPRAHAPRASTGSGWGGERAQGLRGELAATGRRREEKSAQTPPSLIFLPQIQPQSASVEEAVSTEDIQKGLSACCCLSQERWPRKGDAQGRRTGARFRGRFFPLTVQTWHFGEE
jgi:hypothetical protein